MLFFEHMAEPIESIEEVRGRDMSNAEVQRASQPKPTWFVKKMWTKNQEVFACEEREAWDLLNNHSTWKRSGSDFQFIGHSDGKTYKKVVDSSIIEVKRLEPEMATIRAEIARYRKAEEHLLVNEAVDMDGDPKDAVNEENKAKVKRLQTIVNKLDDKLEKLETEYRSNTKGIVQKATEAEMKVAIKNWKARRVWPGAVNISTPDANPAERQRILTMMGQR